MSGLKDAELELLAKILFGIAIVLSPIGLIAIVCDAIFGRGLKPEDLGPFLQLLGFFGGGLAVAIWVGRTKWGWFRKKKD